jgi:hypothetical protein
VSDVYWFSSKVRFVCFVETIGAYRYMDSVYVFQSADFDAAFTRVLELGRAQEKSFLNEDDQQVVWKLKEIISLDLIDTASLDGAEVYSEPVELPPDEALPFNAELHPEESHPTQTV